MKPKFKFGCKNLKENLTKYLIEKKIWIINDIISLKIRKYTASIKLTPKNIAIAGTNEFTKVLKTLIWQTLLN